MHASPATEGDRGGPAELEETHVSIVVLQGEHAYKLKKPVQLGFLDFRRREARLHACRQEVLVNRRLAPDVYLGVADITGVDGTVCDHLVVMRRMPATRRLSVMLQTQEDVAAALRAVARTVAAFHARAERGPDIDRDASAEAMRALWDVNLAELRPFVGPVLETATVERVRSLAGRYLHGRAALFRLRIEQQHAVDGHGDLLADDIYCLDDGPRILDCVEFDPQLRHGDVLLDVAMLAMDLERLGRHDLALRFLDDYREFSGADHPQSLVHHYIAYRALVRCKIACLRHAQGDESAAGAACDLLEIALAHLEQSRVTLALVGGAPGAGKSTLATALSDAAGWALLRSDAVRDEMREMREGAVLRRQAFEQGRYAPEPVRHVYAELLHRAESLLRRGESVILDATWRDAHERSMAALAADRAGATLVAVRCEAPDTVRQERLVERAGRGAGTSEATTAIADRIAIAFDPWPDAAVVDTTQALADQVDAVLAAADAL